MKCPVISIDNKKVGDIELDEAVFAAAARPDILLMDEPFASLDPETATRMIRLAAGLLDRSGAGLFLVTHDAGEPARLEAQVFRLSGHPAVLQRDRD